MHDEYLGKLKQAAHHPRLNRSRSNRALIPTFSCKVEHMLAVNKNRVSLVAVLRSSVCPSQITGLVIAFVIDSINARPIWPFAKVKKYPISEGNKIFKPRFVHRYATTAVVNPTSIIWITYSLFYTCPNNVKRMVPIVVLSGHRAESVDAKATARLGLTRSKVVAFNLVNDATLTRTPPRPLTCIPKNSPSSENCLSQVGKGWLIRMLSKLNCCLCISGSTHIAPKKRIAGCCVRQAEESAELPGNPLLCFV